MKIERKWHNLVLDGNEIEDMDHLAVALLYRMTADLLNDIYELYEKGSLQLWLRSHYCEDTAEELENLRLSGNKVENLYALCSCLHSRVEKDAIIEAVIRTLELDGEEISGMKDLIEHPSTELLDLYKDGTLSLWLRYHNGKDEADKLDNLTLSGDRAQDLYAICQAVGIVITLEDIRNALEEEEES